MDDDEKETEGIEGSKRKRTADEERQRKDGCKQPGASLQREEKTREEKDELCPSRRKAELHPPRKRADLTKKLHPTRWTAAKRKGLHPTRLKAEKTSKYENIK